MKRIVVLTEPAKDSGYRQTRHFRNFLWWVGIAAVGFFALEASSRSASEPYDAKVGPRVESEAFVALRLPRVSEEANSRDFTPRKLDEMLDALAKKQYSTIHYRDVQGFYDRGTPLPKNPVMLVVPEAWRDTIDAVDASLGKHGQRAVVFIDVAEIERVNLNLASRIRLVQMVESGRWELGVAACNAQIAPEVEGTTPMSEVERLQKAKMTLEQWTGVPVRAVDCRTAFADREGRQHWIETARGAGFAVGFVRGRAAANYRLDYPLALGSVPMQESWRAQDLTRRLAAFEPRRDPYVDTFDDTAVDPSWIVDAGQVDAAKGMLEIKNNGGELGLLRLGGTENWRDAVVDVELSGAPKGQFWLYLRRQGSNPFVRLGRIGNQVLFQRSDAEGGTRLVARRDVSGKSRLALRIVGNRVLATLDGEPLTDRPDAVPETLVFGPVSLAVWNDKGEALARLASVRVEPLPRLAAVVSASPTASEWRALNQQIDVLSEISPRSFEWTAKGARELRRPESGLVIFSHYHRLALRPAVVIDFDLPPAEYPRLTQQIREWAKDPSFDGINLVVRGEGALLEPPPRLLADLADLRQSLRKDGNDLSITFQGGPERFLPPTLVPWAPYRTEAKATKAAFMIAKAE